MKALVALLLLIPSLVWAGSVTLAWDPVTDPVVTGYQILYGTKTGVYGSPVDVPGDAATKTYTVNGLTSGTKYFFVARSRNADKTLFSSNSNEVSGVTPLSGPGALKIVITIGD